MRRFRMAGMVAAALGTCGLAAMFFLPQENLQDDGNPLPAPIDLELLEQSRISARKGLVPTGSLGPRPPTNDRERRWSKIPEYHPDEDMVFFSHIHKTSGTSLSILLANLFPRDSVVPTSHPSKGLQLAGLTGHNETWWKDYQVMFSHNRPNITDDIGLPPTKRPRLLVTVRNPLLHKASIFFESVCRFGRHIKNGTIDQEEATLARIDGKASNSVYNFCRDANLWVGSRQFCYVYRNFQANWLSYGGVVRHPCIMPNPELNSWRAGSGADEVDCDALLVNGEDEAIWEDYYERTADAAIRRLEGALWVGVTERMDQAVCLLFMTLGKSERQIGSFRLKQPRPITVWDENAVEKAARYDKADWRVFDAANDILDLRLWTAKERLKHAGDEERERLGGCFDVLLGASPTGARGGRRV